MKLTNSRIIVVLVLLLNSTFVFSQNDIWQNTNLSGKLSDQYGISHYYDANDQALRNKLSLAPNEVRGITDTIELPMPDGSLAKFNIVESSVMEDGLAEKFPEIKSYKVYGIDDPTASGRVDISPQGFRGMLMTSQGRVFIDPTPATASRYTSSFRSGYRSQSDQPYQCGVDTLSDNNKTKGVNFSPSVVLNRTSGSLITYRIAVTATKEYVATVGSGTVAGTIAEINTAINRVNEVYERDLGIRLILVTNNSAIVEIETAEFGLTNGVESTIISENQTVIDEKIGSSNYDIGHVFMTGSGGLAGTPSVCADGSKALGVTGLANPTGDAFWIDFVAHEIGHQFSANHSYSASSGGSCTTRNASTAYEPGSGSTIMSYAAICGVDEDFVTAADAVFHSKSIEEINTYVTTGEGASCSVALTITPANSDPRSVNAGINRTIPKGTAFALAASATDDETLTYQWDQIDLGATDTTLGTDSGNNPLFRSHIPQPTGIRQFPSMGTQIGINTAKFKLGETIPTKPRILNFRVTARDGRSGQAFDEVAITVVDTTFAIDGANNTVTDYTAPLTTTIEWAFAGTDGGTAVNCPNVDIGLLSFSADNSTYGYTTLLDSAPNNGSASVDIADKSSSKSRFVVICSDNIFYDISDTDFNITGSDGAFLTTGRSTNVSTASSYLDIATTTTTTTTPPAASTGGGGGASDTTLIKLLFGLFLVVMLFGVYSQPKALKQFIKK